MRAAGQLWRDGHASDARHLAAAHGSWVDGEPAVENPLRRGSALTGARQPVAGEGPGALELVWSHRDHYLVGRVPGRGRGRRPRAPGAAHRQYAVLSAGPSPP